LGKERLITFGACELYNSTVNDPTEVSNETYVASADIVVRAESVGDACRTLDAVSRSKVYSV